MSKFLQNCFSQIKKDPLFYALLSFCAGGFFIFSNLVSEIIEGESHTIDISILSAMRDPLDSSNPWGPGWFQEMMRDFTGLGGTAVLTLITTATIIYFLITRKRTLGLFVLCSVGTGIFFSNILKASFNRPRPDLFPHDSIVSSASLPSGHALMSALVYLTLGALLAEAHRSRHIKIYIMSLAILITFLVGVSRVYLGVHWPSDVIAGWLAGASWATMFWLLAHCIKMRRQ